MLKKIKKQLNKKDGVSILFAMALFILVSMICAVIITAALTALKTAKTNKEAIQLQQSLDSAALLIKNNLNNVTVTEQRSTNSITGTTSSWTKEYSKDGEILGDADKNLNLYFLHEIDKFIECFDTNKAGNTVDIQDPDYTYDNLETEMRADSTFSYFLPYIYIGDGYADVRDYGILYISVDGCDDMTDVPIIYTVVETGNTVNESNNQITEINYLMTFELLGKNVDGGPEVERTIQFDIVCSVPYNEISNILSEDNGIIGTTTTETRKYTWTIDSVS